MPYVLIGHDTAWNILKELANQCLSFVYVDRQGNICITRDELGTDRIPEAKKVICETQITEKNAFSYNLPTMSRTIVNRVKIPYLIMETGEEKDNRFEIKEEDISLDEDGCKKVVLNLKNFYPTISKIKSCSANDYENEIDTSIKSIHCCFNKIEITFNSNETATTFYLKIISSSCQKLVSKMHSQNNFLSQKRNGIVEFELDTSYLYGQEKAKNIAEAIIAEYADGKSFIEATWRGNPEAKLESYIQSRSKEEEEIKRYEIINNEISLENGLSFNTKARQN